MMTGKHMLWAVMAVIALGCGGALEPGEVRDQRLSELRADPGEAASCTVRYTGRLVGDEFVIDDTIEEGCSQGETCAIEVCTDAIPPICAGTCRQASPGTVARASTIGGRGKGFVSLSL